MCVCVYVCISLGPLWLRADGILNCLDTEVMVQPACSVVRYLYMRLLYVHNRGIRQALSIICLFDTCMLSIFEMHFLGLHLKIFRWFLEGRPCYEKSYAIPNAVS